MSLYSDRKVSAKLTTGFLVSKSVVISVGETNNTPGDNTVSNGFSGSPVGLK